MRRAPVLVLGLVGLALVSSAAPRAAHAGCNLIPGATRTFAGTLGTTNRPFAAPGEFVEVDVRTCDTASPGFAATGPDHVVSVVIKPAGGGPGKLIALATNCAGVDTGACPGSVCQQVTGADLEILQRDGSRHLRFTFPNTDDEQLPMADGLPLVGPTAIAVTRVGEPLPCGLTGGTCSAQAGLTACVDTLFFDDGACGTGFAHPTFPSFTALPPPNDYQADCFDSVPPCTAAANTVRLAVDGGGNLLVPMNWTGVLANTAAPVPRELTINFQPPTPVGAIPSQAFLASYTPEGGLLPPIFEPQVAADAAPNTMKLFGSTDAPYTILRVARRRGVCASGPKTGAACAAAQDCAGAACDTACVGGANDGNTCSSASACPGGACGALFDAAGLAGTGGVVVPRLGPGICQKAPHADCTVSADCPGGGIGNPCVNFAFEAGVAHDLNGVVATSESFGFVVSERVQGGLLNGGAENPATANDDVIILRERLTGNVQPIGNEAVCGINDDPQAPGRAVAKLSSPPFQFHAVTGEGDVVAFLESEADQNQCDANGDGDSVDGILRVFRLGPTEVSAGLNLAADAALDVNGRSLAVSNGLVFFRQPEQASGISSTMWASIDSTGAGGNDSSTLAGGSGRKLSNDGRIVVFSSFATNLAPNLTSDRHVIARDLVTGTNEAVDVDTGGTPVGGGLEAVSGNGRFVGFLSNRPVLPGSTGNSVAYVRDRVNQTTEFASVDSNETLGNGDADNMNLSADGRYVVFASTATNMTGPCNDGHRHIFLRDRTLGTTTCVSVSVPGGVQGDGDSYYPQISDDGNVIAFQSVANNLDPNDANPSALNGDMFVYDRRTSPPQLSIASRTTNGTQILSIVFFPRLSGDGRVLAFENSSPTFCPNGVCVTAKNLDTGVMSRAVQDVTGLTAPTGQTGVGSLSYDGRYLAFYSNAADILPGDTNGTDDVFIADRLTGMVQRIGLTDGGAEPTLRNYLPSISGDGHTVAFSAIGPLDPDDTVSTCNPFGLLNCIGGGNDGASCTTASECPGGTCDQVFDKNCLDIYVHRIGGSEECGNSVLDVGEDCDPPGTPAGACGGQACSPTCHCADNTADLTGDGTLGQTVLSIVDARVGGTDGDLTRLCPAEQVVVGGGTAAFLRPEAAGNSPGCPAASPSLNTADVDALDTVVHLSVLGGPAQNLNRAATALALGATCAGNGTACSQNSDCPDVTCRPPYFAALVSEPEEGNSILNGDGDALDTVLNVYALTGTPGWQSIASVQAADAVAMKGNLAVFTTPEAAQGAGPLNGDGDTFDRVLQLWDAATSTRIDTQIAAEDFVVGDPALVDCGSGPELHQVIAFRTRESAQGSGPLNGDGDTTDSVLYVIDYDVNAHLGTLIDKQVAVTPCPLEACDPRFPYRIDGKRVKFLTREPEQGNRDLNDDGDTTDLILQTVDICTGALTPIAAVDETIDDDPALVGNDPTADPTADESSVAVANGGRCYQGATLVLVPATCTTDDDCPAGAVCTAGLVVVATPIEDIDVDGVPDAIDNCPTVFNDTQSDVDGDGVGDACDAVQIIGCELSPRMMCQAPFLAGKSQLKIDDKPGESTDTITWKWQKGTSTDLADFGTPTTTMPYALCLYDESGPTPELVFEGFVPAGGTCGTKPCWKANGSSGFAFKSKTGTARGITQVKLKAGLDGKAQAMVQGKGANLLLPGLPLGLPVRAQLQAGNGECWETVHGAAGLGKNTIERFQGKDL